MRNSRLYRTNVLISIILIIGFTLTAIFSYQANYQTSLDSIEQVSSLTTEGIYYQISSMFTKPVNVSITMAHDSLLVDHLEQEKNHLQDEEYIKTTMEYLNGYQKKYDFDSVFLVSTATNRYYNFNGLDRIITKDNPENEWYYSFLEDDREYSLKVDNDEVQGADNAITVFVNCRIQDRQGAILGIIGVGIRIDYLTELLKSYEDKYGLEAYLIDQQGTIQISTSYTGYQQADWFQTYHQEEIKEQVLGWTKDTGNLELWSTSDTNDSNSKNFVVTRYIPELSWHLVVKQNTGNFVRQIKQRLYLTVFFVIFVILTVLLVITRVIRRFNQQITQLIEEREEVFRKATEQLYDNIYELNITKNSYVGERTVQYFESLGAGGLPFDQGLRMIAQKQIKEEYREGYINTFTPENVKREYEMGNDHLRYDFRITQDGVNYHWMRIDAYIFFSPEDQCLHMFTYRKNIDEEKQKEKRSKIDEMTGFYTKKATEQMIDYTLKKDRDVTYALFIFDIDNFKQANDKYGHIFGDRCIQLFTEIIRNHFRETDFLGRIGGDEFAAFLSITDVIWVEKKAAELSRALDTVCEYYSCSWRMTASIGVALTTNKGIDFETLYKNADKALYKAKENGKNGFVIDTMQAE